jgi:hypothetical protein
MDELSTMSIAVAINIPDIHHDPTAGNFTEEGRRGKFQVSLVFKMSKPPGESSRNPIKGYGGNVQVAVAIEILPMASSRHSLKEVCFLKSFPTSIQANAIPWHFALGIRCRH